MKNNLLLMFFVLVSYSLSYPQSPLVQDIINDTNIDSLVYFVRELSGDVETTIGGQPYTIVSRRWNHAGNDMAANYIKEKLEGYGLPTYDQYFGTGGGRNIYAVQTGTTYPNKKYIICAHYDDFTYSGTIVPGADDNASGTAAVLEAARLFKNYNSKYTLIFALWDEEERGLFGSEYYAQQAALAGDSIMGVINLDMIAYDGNNDGNADIHNSPIGTTGFIKDKMLEVNLQYSINLDLDVVPAQPYSDHQSFLDHGYGAILLIEDDNNFNPYYHSSSDLIQYFNLPYFHKMSQVSLGVTATLAELTDIVPVEMLTFTATLNGSEIRLLWSTATELNNKGFEIERSENNHNNFVAIGFVEGNGSSTETNHYSFTDNFQLSGVNNLYYRLKQIDYDGTFSYSNMVNVSFEVLSDYSLNQNYPNPFNPSTKIDFTLPADGFVTLKVFNVLGNEVSSLVNEVKQAGRHSVYFDASALPSGVYFYTIEVNDFTDSRKMMLLK